MKVLKLLLIFLLFSACQSKVKTDEAVLVSPEGKRSPVLSLEIADDHPERQLGLMYRKELPSNKGMLFIFPEEEPRSFWMKNTFIELDIAFLNSNYEIVSIVERAPPLTEKHRESSVPARYVLEVLGGNLRQWGIGVGSKLEIKR